MKKLYSFYRIYDGIDNYIGVTNRPINQRISSHKFRAFKENNQSILYKHIRNSSSMMYQVFDQDILTDEDARNKELMYIKFLKPSLNTYHAS